LAVSCSRGHFLFKKGTSRRYDTLQRVIVKMMSQVAVFLLGRLSSLEDPHSEIYQAGGIE
jgi:hypothetical protein